MITRSYLSTEEAAEVMGYSRQHVRVLIHEGRLKGDRVGKNWLVSRSSVQDYIMQKRNLSLFGNSKRGRPPRGSNRRIVDGDGSQTK